MYVVSWLDFLTLENWYSVGDGLHIAAVYSPLIPQAICSRVPPKRAARVFLLQWADYAGGLVGLVSPECGWLPGLALHNATGCYLAGLVQRGLVVEPLEIPRAGSGSLVGRVRVP